MKRLLFFIVALCYVASTFAQTNTNQSPILFIYDASGSMWGKLDGKTKKEIAADVLTTTVNKLPAYQKVGLVAYGHREKSDCKDVEFLVALNNTTKSSVTNAIKNINPLGRTPLAYSATLVINSLRESKSKATIILITDGIESCDGNLCDVITKAKAEGIDFKLHIVGFGLKDAETKELKCAAQAGDGKYYDAQNADNLGEGMSAATSQTVDDPAPNFSVFVTKNNKAVDAWVTARQAGANRDAAADRSYGDTAEVYLKPGKYTVRVRALAGTDLKERALEIEIKKGEKQHKNISFDAAKLKIATTNNGKPQDAVVKVFELNTKKVVAEVRMYDREQSLEIPPGDYDVTMQAMTIKGMETFHQIKKLNVATGKDTKITHDFPTGTAKIGVQTAGGELIDAVVTFTEVKSKKNIVGQRTYTSSTSNPKEFILSPGTYSVKITTLGKHKGNTKTIQVQVEKGKTVEKIITF